MPRETPLPQAPRVTGPWNRPWGRMATYRWPNRPPPDSITTSLPILCGVREVHLHHLCIRINSNNSMAFPHPLTKFTDQMIGFIVTVINFNNKIEKILKGSLDSILSLSTLVKIQIMDGKICLRCKGETLLGVLNFLKTKKFVDNNQQCFASPPQANFPAHDLNFH